MAKKKAFNPFEHHHPHHDHEPEVKYEDLDPAQKSLADALRTSFMILKLVMLVMIVVYLCSGIFSVASGDVAVILRFGQVVGDEQSSVIQPGTVKFTLPAPIDQVVFVPSRSNTQFILIEDTFWYEKSDKTKTTAEEAKSASALNPEKQGSLITGDANIVHAQFKVFYHIENPIHFIQSLADLNETDSAAMIKKAESIISAAVEEGIVHAVSQVKADSVIKNAMTATVAVAKREAQSALDSMNCGVKIDTLVAVQTAMPLKVKAAYDAVITANNTASTEVSKANATKTLMLNGAAGEAHTALWQLIQLYELAVAAVDSVDPQEAEKAKAELARLDALLESAFLSQRIELGKDNYVTIGGDAAALINDAQSARSKIVADAKSNADEFRDLLKEYKRHPRVFVNREWQAARERILDDWRRIELFYLPTTYPRIKVGPDPGLRDRREKDKKAAGLPG
jgi:modulator of FtsH protease HflK